MAIKLRIKKRPKEQRRAKGPTTVDLDLRERMKTARQLRANQASQEEARQLDTMNQLPSHLTDTVNPLVQALKGMNGRDILDTSPRQPSSPGEGQPGFLTERTPTSTEKSGVSRSRKLDDWLNAPRTRDSVQSMSNNEPIENLNIPKPSEKRRKRILAIQQDAQSSLTESVLSLCSSLYGDNQRKKEAFIDSLSYNIGGLFDENVDPVQVPIVPTLLNVCNQSLGESFPSFARLGHPMTVLLTDVFRSVLANESRGHFVAVKGLVNLMGGVLTPADCASWLGFMAFGIAFLDFCKLAGENQEAEGQTDKRKE